MRIFGGNYLNNLIVDSFAYFMVDFLADKNYRLLIDYSKLLNFFNNSEVYYGFYADFYLNFKNFLKLTEARVFSDLEKGKITFETLIESGSILYFDVHISANEKTLKEFVDFAKATYQEGKDLKEVLLEDINKSRLPISFSEKSSPYQLFLIKSFVDSLFLLEVE